MFTVAVGTVSCTAVAVAAQVADVARGNATAALLRPLMGRGGGACEYRSDRA